jgi:hypothetical protein
LNIAPFLRAYQWLILHWKVWGIPGLAATGAKILQMWYSLRKARQELINSQLEGKRLKAEIGRLENEKATLEREVLIAAMMRDIEDAAAKSPPNIVPDVQPVPGDDPLIFKEAKYRWERERKDRIAGIRQPARFRAFGR